MSSLGLISSSLQSRSQQVLPISLEEEKIEQPENSNQRKKKNQNLDERNPIEQIPEQESIQSVEEKSHNIQDVNLDPAAKQRIKDRKKELGHIMKILDKSVSITQNC